jgi:2-dehydro-3-deoxygluconokinase
MTKLDALFTKKHEGTFATLGEIMIRLSPPGMERLFQSPSLEVNFGGGESNVAVSLAIQGLPSRFITALPENDLGRSAIQTLRSFGVDVSRILTRPGTRMGIYFMEKGANQRPSRVIYDRENTAISTLPADAMDWDNAFQGCRWFHITGITPALSKNCANLSLEAMKNAKDKGLVTSLDLNYRAKLWNYGEDPVPIMKKLASLANVIIANEEDCQKSLGIGKDIDPAGGDIREEQYRELMSRVLKEFSGASLVAITLRESVSASHNRWSACISDRESRYFSKKYDITHIVDRVGGGDSFCAGLISGLATMDTMEDALEYAVAASCLNHSIEGDVNRSTRGEIMALYGGDASGRIQR